jgi:hypothetical protein
MVEQKEMSLQDLERVMSGLYDLTSLSQSYNNAKTPSDRSRILSGTVKTLDHIAGNEDPKVTEQVMANLEISPEAYQLKTRNRIGQLAAGIAQDYEAHKPAIRSAVIEKLNASLNGAEDKADAIRSLYYAFLPLLNVEEPTQEEADKELETKVRAVLGMNTVSNAGRGDQKAMHDLRYRKALADYVTETKDGEGKATYRINEGKIDELLNDPLHGAVLYSARPPKENKST